MPSGWDVYYIIFLSATLALGIPAVLAAASFMFGGKKKSLPGQTHAPTSGRAGAAEPGTESSILGQRINTRIFLGTNVALLLIALVLMLIPCIVDVGPQGATGKGIVQTRALVAIVSIALFAAMGLIYAVRKQDLSWLKTFRTERPETPEVDEKS